MCHHMNNVPTGKRHGSESRAWDVNSKLGQGNLMPLLVYKQSHSTWPVRIRVWIDSPHPRSVCHKMQLNGMVLRKNWGPVSQQVWHNKNPFLLKGSECQFKHSRTKFCNLTSNDGVSIYRYKWKKFWAGHKTENNQSIFQLNHLRHTLFTPFAS